MRDTGPGLSTLSVLLSFRYCTSQMLHVLQIEDKTIHSKKITTRVTATPSSLHLDPSSVSLRRACTQDAELTCVHLLLCPVGHVTGAQQKHSGCRRGLDHARAFPCSRGQRFQKQSVGQEGGRKWQIVPSSRAEA